MLKKKTPLNLTGIHSLTNKLIKYGTLICRRDRTRTCISFYPIGQLIHFLNVSYFQISTNGFLTHCVYQFRHLTVLFPYKPSALRKPQETRETLFLLLSNLSHSNFSRCFKCWDNIFFGLHINATVFTPIAFCTSAT